VNLVSSSLQPSFEDFPVTHVNQRTGDKGTFDTVVQMGKLVDFGRKDMRVHSAAADITRHLNWENPKVIVRALWRWVTDNITYRLDPEGVELVRSCEVTLAQRVGDCDCQSVLLASLIAASVPDVPLSFIVCRTQEGGPFAHILTAALFDGEWVPLETIEDIGFGRLPKEVTSCVVSELEWKGEALGILRSFGKDVKEPNEALGALGQSDDSALELVQSGFFKGLPLILKFAVIVGSAGALFFIGRNVLKRMRA